MTLPGLKRDHDAVALAAEDNVATAMRALAEGDTVAIRHGAKLVEMMVIADVPLGHKFALNTIGQGAPVVKYGSAIGIATSEISKGAHVHVHNVKSGRAKRGTA